MDERSGYKDEKVNAQAINNYVVMSVVPHASPEEKTGGFTIVRSTRSEGQSTRWHRVITKGPGVPDIHGHLLVPNVEEGNLVYVNSHGREEIYGENMGMDSNLWVCSILDIMAKITDENTMTVEPLGDYIEIDPIEPVVKEGEIIMAERAATAPCFARVGVCGTGWTTAEGSPVPMHVKTGDLIGYLPFQTHVIDLAQLGIDRKIRLVRHASIAFVVRQEEE